jgi:hypothetical protein
MATLINTRTFFNAQTKVIQTIYSNTEPFKPLRYPSFFNYFEGDEDRSFWQAMSVVGFGLLALKQEGQTPAIDASKEGVLSQYAWISYALRYIVTKEMAREDAKRLIPKLPPLLRYSSDQTKEYIFWNVLNLGFTNAASGGYNMADGLPLFSNAHTIAGASATGVTTFSNYLGAVALTVETLNQAFVLMANMPDDRGLTTSRTPVDLWYPLGLHQTAIEVIASFYYPHSDANKVNTAAGSVDPHAIEYLTAPATGPFPWFVAAGKGPLGTDSHSAFANIKWDEQRAWVDPNTTNMNHETEFRAVWGVVTPRGLVGSAGA